MARSGRNGSAILAAKRVSLNALTMGRTDFYVLNFATREYLSGPGNFQDSGVITEMLHLAASELGWALADVGVVIAKWDEKLDDDALLLRLFDGQPCAEVGILYDGQPYQRAHHGIEFFRGHSWLSPEETSLPSYEHLQVSHPAHTVSHPVLQAHNVAPLNKETYRTVYRKYVHKAIPKQDMAVPPAFTGLTWPQYCIARHIMASYTDTGASNRQPVIWGYQ